VAIYLTEGWPPEMNDRLLVRKVEQPTVFMGRVTCSGEGEKCPDPLPEFWAENIWYEGFLPGGLYHGCHFHSPLSGFGKPLIDEDLSQWLYIFGCDFLFYEPLHYLEQLALTDVKE